MNLKHQIDYWTKGAEEDLITAQMLIANNRLIHGLFWCHLVIEKSIKAHVVRCTNEIPPKTHNLQLLLSKTDLVLDPELEKLLGSLMVYQLEGRYPEFYPATPSRNYALEILNQTKTLHQWLMKKL